MPRSPHSIRFAPGDPPDPTVTVRPMSDDEIRRYGPPGRPASNPPAAVARPDPAPPALRHWVAWARDRWRRHPHGVAADRPFLQAVCARYGPQARDPGLAEAAFWLTWFLDRWTPERVADDWEAVQAEIILCLQCLDYCLGPDPTSP